MDQKTYDVIVVGGGPAGLNAALVLGRCRRKVLVCDSGHPRNGAAEAVHGYLTREGIPPEELREMGREEIKKYGVTYIDVEVVTARVLDEDERPSNWETGFEISLISGERFVSRKLLLATGVRDVLPSINGFETYYGRGVHHCPYCDGWEHRDQRIAAFGEGADAAGLALGLLTWSPHVTLCSHGEEIPERLRDRLTENDITIRTERIIRLEGTGEGGRLDRVVFESGPPLACDALFFHTAHFQQSRLPAALGCKHDRRDEIETGKRQDTGIPGLYLAGDADGDVQFVIVAAAEGAKAAVAINIELQKENRA